MDNLRGWQNQNTRLAWDDERFPFSGRNIDTTTGRLTANYFNGGVDFQANARYPEEVISITGQMSHSWQEGTEIHPHIHWLQTSASVPNWLLAYSVTSIGEVATKATDYTGHTFVVPSEHKITYTSGDLAQLTEFPPIDMTGRTISCGIHIALFRDTANVSGLFAGADPVATAQLVHEFDFHWKRDSYGSWQEYSK